MLTVGAVMAVIMAISAGPASADDWDHGFSRWDHNDGCWEWSWVFERWKYECDDGFWWDRDRYHDWDRWDRNRHHDWDRRDRNRHHH
jgi:hypothetical protein